MKAEAALSLPGEVVGAVLPDASVPGWVELTEAAITVALLASAGTSIGLLCGCRRRAGSSRPD